ncbi:hypothetical protein PHET_05835 [Paragonimus heterotremus]|uniref:Rho-GAP domain-containing protein n=1 Tax=Paragonimus heterotremus TaxID=100268 RepID=A0A8J4WZS3_9TREM|nr:hypothetical protein PHET_05835 [Paragonimus heterotremus]
MDTYIIIFLQVCLPLIEAVTHRPLKHRKAGETEESVYCEGIRIYLSTWTSDEDIESAVEKYIKLPCSLELRAVVRGSHIRALHFLLSYLRARGPLMNWEIRPGNDEVMGRCLNTVLIGQLKQLSELEFTSAVLIGRYLQYLTALAYSHKLFYFRMILAKVWGPLFLRPAFAPIYQVTIEPAQEKQRVELSIAIFTKVLESANWHIFEPFEGMDKVMCDEPEADFHQRMYDDHDPENTYLNIPQHLNGTMSDKMKEESIQFALKNAKATCPVHPTRCSPSDNQSSQPASNVRIPFAPDGCRLR